MATGRPSVHRRSARSASARLSPLLRPLFWDYDWRELSWARDEELILGRVLAEGGWEQARLLRLRLGDQRIADWLLRREGRGLSAQRLRYWELILGLPKRRVDVWVKAARSGPWGQRARR